MARIEHEPDESHCPAFSEFGAVAEGNYVCQPGATWRRFAFGDGRLAVTGIAKFTERIQGNGCDLCYGSAEIILHRILLVIGRTLETAGITAQIIYSLRFISEGFQLEWQRPAARFERELLRLNSSRQQHSQR